MGEAGLKIKAKRKRKTGNLATNLYCTEERKLVLLAPLFIEGSLSLWLKETLFYL